MSKKNDWVVYGLVGLTAITILYFVFRKMGGKKKSTLPNAKKYSQFADEPVKVALQLEPLAYGKYQWGGTSGMPIDIYLKGDQPIFVKSPDGTTYCTGYTFSVAYVCLMNRGMLDNWSNDDVKKLQAVWNQGDAKSKPKLCVDALTKPINNQKTLGKEVTLEDAKPGDFCQIWRSGGSGHSVIFLDRVKQGDKVIGIKYYSSNGSVNKKTGKSGPGEAVEKFTDAGGSVLKNNLYFARLN